MARSVGDWQPGYPIDSRSELLRARAAKDPFLDFEYRAARVMARVTGERVFLQDDNRQARTPDLRIEYPGRSGVGEVVIVTDRGSAGLYAAFEKGDLTFTDERLCWQWWIDFSPRIDRRRLLNLLVDVLEQMEADGEKRSSLVHIDPHTSGPGARRLHELGVLAVASNDNPGVNRGQVIGLPGGVDIPPKVDADFFSQWLDRELESALILSKSEKLRAAAGHVERHLFIGLSWSVPGPVLSMLRREATDLPTSPPTLPRGVTHLWLLGALLPERAIAWWPDQEWFDAAQAWVTD